MKVIKNIYIIWTFSCLLCLNGWTSYANETPTTKKNNIGVKYFTGSFAQALLKAQKEDKMILIDSYTTWCGPCKLIESVYFKDLELSNYINENFVCMRVDAEKKLGRYLKSRYPHGTFPSLLFVKKNGRLKNKFIGLPEHGVQELLNFAKLTRNS